MKAVKHWQHWRLNKHTSHLVILVNLAILVNLVILVNVAIMVNLAILVNLVILAILDAAWTWSSSYKYIIYTGINAQNLCILA